MITFEQAGITLTPESPKLDTEEPSELAVTTYRNLGFDIDEGQARESFSQAFSELAEALEAGDTSDDVDLIMVPKLVGSLTLGGLIERYDKLTSQKGNPATYVFNALWNQYSPDELNQGQTADLEAQAVLLEKDNHYNEPGLYFTNRNLKSQRKDLKTAQKEYDSTSKQTTLRSLSPAGYIIRNAMQLERMQLECDELLQDSVTYTRFVELDNRTVGGSSCVPGAHSDDGGLELGGSDVLALPFVGVRLSVGLKRDQGIWPSIVANSKDQ